MKNLIALSLLLSSLTSMAAFDPTTLSSSNLEDASNELSVDGSHTTVSAPETSGLFGVEVGVFAGQTDSPKFADVLDDEDYDPIYTGGLLGRVHVPLDLFLELSLLPTREFDKIEVKNQTLGAGWNLGGFLGLPLDVAVGWNGSKTEVTYDDLVTAAAINTNLKFKGRSSIFWAGVSKSFLWFTPYFKIGTATTKSEVTLNGTTFGFNASTKEDFKSDGNFVALGANLQFGWFMLGLEGSQTIDVKRYAAKLSLDF